MRDKFSELIAAGVASFQEKPIGNEVPTLDPMVKLYNGLWGLLTDTHMSKVDDGYIITGTFIYTKYWEGFKYCSFYGSTNIKLGSGYPSLDNMITSYGYKMMPDIYNSDKVIKLVPLTDEEMLNRGCPTVCPCDCRVGESKIPHPMKEFLNETQLLEFKNAWEAGEGNAYKVVENLRQAKSFNGSKFRVSADQKYILDEIIKFEL